MPRIHDVIIAGGGPAGLSAAHRLAGRGHQVVLLERNRIGETLKSWLSWTDLLKENGLEEAVLRRLERLTFRSFLGAEYSLAGPYAVSVDESLLLRLLKEKASRSGADIREEEAFLNYRYQDDTIIIRSMKNEYRGRLFIDATGESTAVLRGLTGEAPRPQRMGCLTRRVRVSKNPDPGRCLIYDAFFPGPQYFWVVPLGPEEAMAGVFAFRSLDALTRPVMLDALRRYCAAQGFIPTEGSIREGNIPLSPPLRPAAPRIVFLGDAFSAPLPSSGFGLCRCLEESEIAAECISGFFSGKLESRDLAARIESRRFPGYDLHYIISNMLSGMNDAMLNKAIGNMEKVGASYLYEFLRGRDLSLQFSLRSLKHIYSTYTLAEIQRMALHQRYKDIILRLNKIYPHVTLQIFKEEFGKLVHR